MTVSKMQSVDFRSIEEFLEYLPSNERIITDALRDIIFSAVPGIHEKLKYNVPFYSLKQSLFFIWPAAVLWGKKKSYEGVRVGFSKGYLMSNENGWLDLADRKQVGYHDYINVHDIDRDVLKSFIFQATELDMKNKIW